NVAVNSEEISSPPFSAQNRGGNLLPFAPIAQSGDGLAIAASSTENQEAERIPMVHRLPPSFDPLARFRSANKIRLPYTPASALPHAPSFERPEGSFAVRAFGNVVHRFLHFVSVNLAAGETAEGLLANLYSWEPRLLAALRNEGVSPAVSKREAPRALAALRNALTDSTGRWILSSHQSAASEHSIASLSASV